MLLTAFLIAMTGYLLAYNAYIKRSGAFFPMAFCSLCVLTVYISGLMGSLAAGLYVLIFCGNVLIPVVIVRSKGSFISLIKTSFLTPSILFILIGTAWAYVITRGVGISHRDDLSHWYRICKSVFFEGSFPKTPDIKFPSYAPGTACFIYCITRITSFDVSRCFFAQSLINLSACASLSAVSSKCVSNGSRVVSYILVSLTSVMLCALDISTYSLLVDCTLGLAAMVLAVYVLCYGESFGISDLAVLGLMSSMLILIKTSGILFLVFVLSLYIFRFGKDKIKALRFAAFTVVIPLVFSIGYSIRGHYFYPDIGMSEQSVSVARFSSLVGDKSSSLIVNTITDCFVKSLPLIGKCAQVNVFWIFAAALFVYEYKTRVRHRLSLFLLGVYYVYIAGLAGTYVFSMNAEEAAGLVCYYRYVGTASVFICGIVCFVLLEALVSASGERIKLYGNLAYLVAVVLVSNLILSSGYILGRSYYVPTEKYSTGAWDALCRYAPENTAYTSDSYMVIWDDDIVFDDGIYGHKVQEMSEAYFRSDNVYVLTYNYVDKIGLSEEDQERLDSADHIVVVGEDDPRIAPLGIRSGVN